MTNDKLTAWLRTAIPGLWAALVTWLVTLGLPSGIAEVLSGGEEFVTAAVLAGVYAGLRALEPHTPDWATRVLLGSARVPQYPTER